MAEGTFYGQQQKDVVPPEVLASDSLMGQEGLSCVSIESIEDNIRKKNSLGDVINVGAECLLSIDTAGTFMC